MNYVIEKTEDGFTLTFEGEEPQFFADIVELEDVVIARLRNEQELNLHNFHRLFISKNSLYSSFLTWNDTMRYQIYKNDEGKFRIRDEETKEWWHTSKWMTLPLIGSFSVVDKIDFSFEEAQKKALALNKKHTWVLVEEQKNG